jgi:hypothetical protein
MFHDECANTSPIGNTRRYRLRALVAATFITKAKSRRAA